MGVQSQTAYQLSDFKNNQCNPPVLLRELQDAGITEAQDVRVLGVIVTIYFIGFITSEQSTTIDNVVHAHDGYSYSSPVNSYNDPNTQIIPGPDGYWKDIATFDSGPLPPGIYAVVWSAELLCDTEGFGNHIEVQLLMNGIECSTDAINVAAYTKYQDSAWAPRRAGENFVLKMQARAVGITAGSVRRIRFGLLPAITQ